MKELKELLNRIDTLPFTNSGGWVSLPQNVWRAWMYGEVDRARAAQHRMHLTAFGAFCGGTIFGMFIMLVLSAFLGGGR